MAFLLVCGHLDVMVSLPWYPDLMGFILTMQLMDFILDPLPQIGNTCQTLQERMTSSLFHVLGRDTSIPGSGPGIKETQDSGSGVIIMKGCL